MKNKASLCVYFLLMTLFLLNSRQGKMQGLFDSFADGDFTPGPIREGGGAAWPVRANSEVAANGRTGYTLERGLCPTAATSNAITITNVDVLPTVTLVYSQGSGTWNAPNLWNTARNGSGTAVTDPNDISISVVIQNGHTVTMGSLTRSVNDFTVETGGSILAGNTTNRYVQVYGSTVLLDGTVGNEGSGDGFSLDINGPDCTISGSGATVLSRLRKDGSDPGDASVTNLIVDKNIKLIYGVSASSALCNQGNASTTVASTLNLTLSAGNTITVTQSDVSIDGTDGTNSEFNTGTFIIDGTLDIQSGDLWVTSDNPGGSITYAIGSGGRIIVGGKVEGNAGTAGSALAGLTIASGGTLELQGGGGVFNALSGTRNSFSFGNGAIIDYAGTSTQTIEDFFIYPNLSINGGGNKNMEGPTEVDGTLSLNSGNIVTGHFDLKINNGGSIEGGSPASYVQTSGTGTLQQTVGSTGFLFPVGNSTFNPVILDNSGGTVDEYRVRVRDEVLSNGTSGMPFPGGVVDRTWDIGEQTPGGSSLDVIVEWAAGEERSGFDRQACYLSRWDGSGWGAPLPEAAAYAGADRYTIARSNVMSLSPFAVGSNGVLPVQLVSFQAMAAGNRVRLHWSTAGEQNNAFFSVERSTDGHTFAEIGRLKGAGTTYVPQEYELFDPQPNPGINYYRLRQTDAGGKSTLHRIVSVAFREGNNPVSLFPNPASDELTLRLPGPGTGSGQWQIMDLQGHPLKQGKTPEKVTQWRISLDELAPGLYILKLETGITSFSRPFLKK